MKGSQGIITIWDGLMIPLCYDGLGICFAVGLGFWNLRNGALALDSVIIQLGIILLLRSVF